MAHQKNIISFFSLWWMIKGIWALFSLLFIFLWNRKPWLDSFVFIITLACSKLWIWMGISFRDILLIRISRGANNCPTCIWEKHLFHNDITPPHLKFLLSNERLDFFYIYILRSKGLTMQIHFHRLWSDLPRVSIFLAMTVYQNSLAYNRRIKYIIFFYFERNVDLKYLNCQRYTF